MICLCHHLSHVTCTSLSDDQPYRTHHTIDYASIMSIFHGHSCHSKYTLTPQRWCPSTLRRTLSPRLWRTQSRVLLKVSFRDFSRLSLYRESLSRVSFSSDVALTCFMRFVYFIFLSSRFSLNFHWNWKTSVSFTIPAVFSKRSRILPNASISFLSVTTYFKSSFARADVIPTNKV